VEVIPVNAQSPTTAVSAPKKTDFYPRVAPRELAVKLAQIVLAPENRQNDARKEIDSFYSICKDGQAPHSRRYLEQAYSVVQKELMGTMAEKERLFQSLEAIRARSPGRMALIGKSHEAEYEIAKDAYHRTMDDLAKKKSKLSPASLIGQISASITFIIGSVSVIWEYMSKFPVVWRIAASAFATTALIGAFGFIRKKLTRTIPEEIEQTKKKFLVESENISKKIQKLLDDVSASESEQVRNLQNGLNAFVKKSAVSCAIHVFDIAMDFYPEYVKAEIAKLTVKQFDFQNREQRTEALSILRQALEGDSRESLTLYLNG